MENKILFVCDGPSPYKIEFFNLMHEKIDIHVAFAAQKTAVRDKSWFNMEAIKFEYTVLTDKNCEDKTVSLALIKLIKKHKFKEIVITNPTNLISVLAMWYMRMKSISYCVSIDGARFSKKTLENGIKKSVFKGGKAFFSPSAESDEYYTKNAVKSEKIIRYPFTSIYDRDILPQVTKIKKQEAKDLLGIKEEKMILNIGQIIHRKGIDILLKACENLSSKVGVYIVGGSSTQDLNKIIEEKKLKNIHFISFQDKDTIKTYMKAADVFAFPTREDIWGLVVNEAMSQGLPVITTDNCVAGLEMVVDGENGYIIPVEDSETLREKIDAVLADDKLQEKLSKGAISTAKDYTFEKMAQAHIAYLVKESKLK